MRGKRLAPTRDLKAKFRHLTGNHAHDQDDTIDQSNVLVAVLASTLSLTTKYDKNSTNSTTKQDLRVIHCTLYVLPFTRRGLFTYS